MKKLVSITFQSSKESFQENQKNSSFEIFGFDFIIDQKFKIWLIEVNTNPCLEESSSLLCSFLPRMIDDALKLTIDVQFKKKFNLPNINQSTEESEDEEDPIPKTFPVYGYQDDENLWEQLL